MDGIMVTGYALIHNIPLLMHNLLIGEEFVGSGTLHHRGMMPAQLHIIHIITMMPMASCTCQPEMDATSYLLFTGDCFGNVYYTIN